MIHREKYVIIVTTLYSAFNRLLKNEYIESFYKDVTYGRKRTYYRIKEKENKYFQDKCLEWQITKEVINRFIKEGEI
ncbi:hypothetical protein [Cytobacillus kochii]|uniref:PadR family transcriptional regulator n=1 Tax=Cytobacillus kochii TaxID=859143 RepID=UPI002E1ABAD0